MGAGARQAALETAMSAAIRLEDRGVVRVEGEEAASFLQGLVTNDVLTCPEGEARFAALLSPQGKILFDFIAVRSAAGFRLDCPRPLAGELARRLGFYKLRAQVAIADESEALGVAALLDGAAEPSGAVAVYADPRDPKLGRRAIAPRATLAGLSDGRNAYDAQRIALCIPEGGAEFAYGDVFPHDANMDLLHGVDFAKGCYVGQEVVARMQHRGGVRKRAVQLRFAGAAPPSGTPVLDGEVALGVLGRSEGRAALAILRNDRVEEMSNAGRNLTVGGAAAELVAS
jgi:tRNA-modifying protein YgfZ